MEQSGTTTPPSHLLVPVLAAIQESSRRIVSRIEETEKVCENIKIEMKLLMKESEDKAAEKAMAKLQSMLDSSNQCEKRSYNSKRKVSEPSEALEGVDAICEDAKVSAALSVWLCNRISSDLNLYWSSTPIDGHNSSLSVLLFGIQRKEGLGPYMTSLGKDMGTQAREVVSSLMWSARCANKLKTSYERPIPKWIYSLVPICRDLNLGLPSHSSPNSAEKTPPSSVLPNERNNSSHSTQRSEANELQDYIDLADDTGAWRKEVTFFREAVFKGCQSVEQRKTKEKSRKQQRSSILQTMSAQSGNRNLSEAQEVISIGAQLVRKTYSNILSQNRCNARERFFDSIGFVLYKIQKMGRANAKAEGFDVEITPLSPAELQLMEDEIMWSENIKGARTSGDLPETDVSCTNQQYLKQLTEKFPSLKVRILYKVDVEKETEEHVPQTAHDIAEKPIPDHVINDESVNLILLSLVILTEFTRCRDGLEFISASKASLQSVLCIAIALRGLICRSLKENMSPFEQYLLGNVYLLPDDIPPNMNDVSTVMSFILDESNRTRARNKLVMTRKQYLNHSFTEAERERSDRRLHEDLVDHLEGIFTVPGSL